MIRIWQSTWQSVACALALVLLTTLPAQAESAAAEAEAKVLKMQANGVFQRGDYAEAIRLYEQSYQLHANPNTLFNLAQCYRQLKQYKKAIFAFRNYLIGVPNAANRADVEAVVTELETIEKQQAGSPPATAVQPGSPAPSAGNFEAAMADTTPLKQPLGLRAAIGKVVDMRADEPGAFNPKLAGVFAFVVGRELTRRDRFGSDAVSRPTLEITTDVLAARAGTRPLKGSELTVNGMPSHLAGKAQALVLEARVRVHVRLLSGGPPVRNYVITRSRIQTHPLHPDDVAVLATLIAEEAHARIEHEMVPFLRLVRR